MDIPSCRRCPSCWVTGASVPPGDAGRSRPACACPHCPPAAGDDSPLRQVTCGGSGPPWGFSFASVHHRALSTHTWQPGRLGRSGESTRGWRCWLPADTWARRTLGPPGQGPDPTPAPGAPGLCGQGSGGTLERSHPLGRLSWRQSQGRPLRLALQAAAPVAVTRPHRRWSRTPSASVPSAFSSAP